MVGQTRITMPATGAKRSGARCGGRPQMAQAGRVGASKGRAQLPDKLPARRDLDQALQMLMLVVTAAPLRETSQIDTARDHASRFEVRGPKSTRVRRDVRSSVASKESFHRGPTKEPR